MVNNKLRNKSGETIAEVLVAGLVVMLGVLLFATMVSSSFRIISKSETKMKRIYEAESYVEGHTGSSETPSPHIAVTGFGDLNGFVIANDTKNIKVKVYKDKESGETEIKEIRSYEYVKS